MKCNLFFRIFFSLVFLLKKNFINKTRRIKDEKEREVQRLRELQEKAYDRQVNTKDFKN